MPPSRSIPSGGTFKFQTLCQYPVAATVQNESGLSCHTIPSGGISEVQTSSQVQHESGLSSHSIASGGIFEFQTLCQYPATANWKLSHKKETKTKKLKTGTEFLKC